MEITRHDSLEDVFDIEPGTTIVPGPVQSTEVVEVSSVDTGKYDDRDVSIDGQLSEIQKEALELARNIKNEMQFSDPRGLPRLGEVAIAALGTALDAVKQKSDIKKHKDKLSTSSGESTPSKIVNNTQNNTLVISRAELLKQISAGVI